MSRSNIATTAALGILATILSTLFSGTFEQTSAQTSTSAEICNRGDKPIEYVVTRSADGWRVIEAERCRVVFARPGAHIAFVVTDRRGANQAVFTPIDPAPDAEENAFVSDKQWICAPGSSVGKARLRRGAACRPGEIALKSSYRAQGGGRSVTIDLQFSSSNFSLIDIVVEEDMGLVFRTLDWRSRATISAGKDRFTQERCRQTVEKTLTGALRIIQANALLKCLSSVVSCDALRYTQAYQFCLSCPDAACRRIFAAHPRCRKSRIGAGRSYVGCPENMLELLRP